MNTPTMQFLARRWSAWPFAIAGALLLPQNAGATNSTVHFAGVIEFIQELEYGTSMPLPPGSIPLLPHFQGATMITGSYTYDTGVLDSNPDPNAGQYLDGSGVLTVTLPEIGMTLNGSGLGLSVYPATLFGDQFQVNANASGFIGDAGGATPFAISVLFFGPSGLLIGDGLPAGPLAWAGGNAHLDFNNVTPPRDIFIGFSAVPVPPALWLLGSTFVGLASCARRGNRAANS